MTPEDVGRSVSVVLVFCALSGCASTQTRVARGEAKLLRETVTVGLVEVSAILDIGGKRFEVFTYVSDCRKRRGEIVSEFHQSDWFNLQNLLYGGPAPADRLFT